jgi:D-alanyl-D-alanine carboxypeptidase
MVAAGVVAGLGTPALAAARAEQRPDPHVAEVLVDAGTGGLLYADQADAPRRPASLTKIMTLFLAFDAIDAGRLDPDDAVTISRFAARQPASRLGLAAGKSLSVRTALRVIAVHSANDVAVALAERLAGSEPAFVARMNARARQLGLRHTHFANATGLTNTGNVTTARDIASLSLALLRQHPRDYPVFATRKVNWNKRQLANHNHLLGRVAGVDGIKTGYTVDAGYNLAASAKRHGRRIIAVVLGERSIAARDVRVANLVELGFGPSRTVQARAGAGRSIRMSAAPIRRRGERS